jgi:hypothetical protein
MGKEVDELWFCRDMVAVGPLRLRYRRFKPRDGLWMVKTRKGVLGGYLIWKGKVVRASPVLRPHLQTWACRNGEFWGEPWAC